jgi:hypothetical protein
MEEGYKKLCQALARRGGGYPGMDIPEFYALARELFFEVPRDRKALRTALEAST